MTQSRMDKVFVSGYADSGKKVALLQATCHQNEVILAKQILQELYRVEPCGWEVEMQDDVLVFWSALHPTFGCRMKFSQLNKGLSVIRSKGAGLIERIRAGAC